MNASRTAYLVLAHTDPMQCARLTRALLLDAQAHVFLHVDLKSKFDFADVLSIDSYRVHWVSTRYAVAWGGFNMVRASLAAMQEAVNSAANFDYLVLLSGMDYPISHPLAIRDHIRSLPYRQIINRIDVRDSPEHYLRIATHFDFRDTWLPSRTMDKVLRKICTLALRPVRRTLPAETVCMGSQWWALTTECARHVLDVARRHSEYEKFFRFTLASDEYYFHTVIQNSKFAGESVPLTPYQGRGTWRMANLHVIDPSLTRIFNLADFDQLMASGKSFVRKVTTADSTSLLDKIDEKLGI